LHSSAHADCSSHDDGGREHSSGEFAVTAGVARPALIIHYHLFKNAGTSTDEMLKQNFGIRWGQHEFAGAGAKRSNVDAVAKYLREHPQLDALSSHTALLPAPVIEGTKVFPMLFIRHPIDRLRSAYLFERGQNTDTPGARLAKETDFAGYLCELLRSPNKRTARNFQTRRLCMNEPLDAGTELERALRTVNKLPFVGLVEAYEQSIERLAHLLTPLFPQFRAIKLERNVTRVRHSTLRERLSAVKKELGKELFAELKSANKDDLEIYRVVRQHYTEAMAFEPEM
jgi:hypothetical protein